MSNKAPQATSAREDRFAGPAFTLKATKDKGHGLFATRHIPAGRRLLKEAPLLALERGQKIKDALWDGLATLSQDKRDIYDRLHFHNAVISDNTAATVRARHDNDQQASSFTEAERRITRDLEALAIFYTNNVGAVWRGTRRSDDELVEGPNCVYETFSRMNHDCDPNVEFYFGRSNMEKPYLIAFAVKDIAVDEELYVSYLDLEEVVSLPERTRALQMWGINCRCARCEQERAGSDCEGPELIV